MLVFEMSDLMAEKSMAFFPPVFRSLHVREQRTEIGYSKDKRGDQSSTW